MMRWTDDLNGNEETMRRSLKEKQEREEKDGDEDDQEKNCDAPSHQAGLWQSQACLLAGYPPRPNPRQDIVAKQRDEDEDYIKWLQHVWGCGKYSGDEYSAQKYSAQKYHVEKYSTEKYTAMKYSGKKYSLFCVSCSQP